MQVIVTGAQLRSHKACDAYFKSPEWDSEQDALIYSDWSNTVERLLSSRTGTVYLDWLITHELVPMTRSEFIEARKTRGGTHV